MTSSSERQTRNIILRSLTDAGYRQILPCLEPVEMPLGRFIYQPEEKIKYIYFPETSVISVVTRLQNGSCVETGIIGNDGISGAETVLAEDSSPREAMVQHGGVGNRMKVKDFRDFCHSDENLSKAVKRYIYSFIGQISQNPACLCFHVIESRLARWLLMFQDRVGGDELNLTQEFIAVMLGVHRPSVSRCAGKLQEQNLINYNRGKIKILDRSGLLENACECYKTIGQIIAEQSR